MGLFGGRASAATRQIVVNIYGKIVEQARAPAFYLDHGVPDTPDGRFDMVMLHAFLVMRRLRREGEGTAALSQALFDLMFDDMDQNLREMGVGDLAVGKRIKAMAKAFYGRVVSYDEGLDAEDAQVLGAALRRNLYRASEPRTSQVMVVAAYMCRESAALDATALAALTGGDWRFGAPPRDDGSDSRGGEGE